MELATCLGRSVSWVKKWLKRLQEAPPDDLAILHSRSRARRTPPPPPDLRIVQKIAEIRQNPPENLQRVPGPRAILYYLHRDASLQAAVIPVPRSTRTVWKILRKLGYILDAPERKRKPLELREPLEEVQMDFKDATTVPADPDGKRQHVVEVLNFVDAGTSILLSAQAHADFHAETALEAVVHFLRQHGLPAMLTFDRDPRWVGSSSGRDFPSALCRFLLCLGIVPNVIPPQQPQKNPYVERYHRSYNQEWGPRASAWNIRAGARGHSAVPGALQRRATSPGALLWQPAATQGISRPAEAACSSSPGEPGCVARHAPRASVRTASRR